MEGHYYHVRIGNRLRDPKLEWNLLPLGDENICNVIGRMESGSETGGTFRSWVETKLCDAGTTYRFRKCYMELPQKRCATYAERVASLEAV